MPALSQYALLPNIAFREHFQRVHRPVQCRRCYRTFSFKHRERSAAVSELDAHYQQDEPCRRGLASLKEGINDAEWSRICEDKKKSWKSKGKDKATNINQTSNPSKQWYEIWAIICPDMEAPSTPCEYITRGNFAALTYTRVSASTLPWTDCLTISIFWMSPKTSISSSSVQSNAQYYTDQMKIF